MIRGLTGEAAPAFDRPLDMLEACHARIDRQCDTLEKLLAHQTHHGADPDAQQAARAILAYFDRAAVQHHDDEERNLFPLLEEAGAPGACDLIVLLTREHDEVAMLWRRLRPLLQEVAEARGCRLDEPLVERFVALNRSHVDFENAHLLPLARRALDPAALERLGRAMAARRSVTYPA